MAKNMKPGFDDQTETYRVTGLRPATKPGTQINALDFAKAKKPVETYGTKAVQRSKGKKK